MRRAQVDGNAHPVRNLITNPSAETSAGVVTLRTNHFRNPAQDTTSIVTTLRTNLATDPRATTYTVPTNGAGWRNTRWFGSTGFAGTYTLVTGATDGPLAQLTSYARKTWTTAGSSTPGDTGFENTTGNGLPVIPNTSYAVSSYLRTSASGKTVAVMTLVWRDAAGTVISTSNPGGIALTAGQWHRISHVATSPANAAYMQVISDQDGGTPWAVGDTLDGTGLLIEQSTIVGPYFDGVTARQNLITNSHFRTDTTGWTFAGTTPVRVATSIFGKPALQLTRTASSVAIAYTGFVPVTVGQKISFSALGSVAAGTAMAIDVEFFNASSAFVSGAPRQYLATSSAGSTTVTTADTPTRWGNSGATVPAGATQARLRLFRDSSADGLTYATDVLLEVSDVANPYYEGAGDFTFSWTGTPNASTSIQTALMAAGWSLENGGRAYRDTSGQMTGANSLKMLASSGDIYATVSTTTAGLPWTLSMDYRTDGVLTGNPRLFISGGSGASVFSSLPLNQPTATRVSVTLPATAAGLVQVVGAIFAATGGDFWVDNVTLEQSSVELPHFSGATPAAGDFTYVWTGTVGNSVSYQQGVGLPSPLSGQGSYTIQSSEWASSGTKSIRNIPTTNASATFPGGTGFAYGMQPGKTYTALTKLRLSAVQTGTLSDYARRLAVFNVGTLIARTAQAPNTVGVHELRLTFTVPVGATTANFALYNGSPDTTVWWDDLMIVEGRYEGPYIDGTKPFSKWDGAPHASTSVGYAS